MVAHSTTSFKKRSPEKPTYLALELSFLDTEHCPYTFLLPSFFSSLDFFFKVEKLQQGQFSSFIYCKVLCMLGGVLPLTNLAVFPHMFLHMWEMAA